MPCISIIVPIYQPPIKYLKKCIESIINQELENIEIILVLDGSNKEIENVVKEYQEKDTRIKCFIQENRGESITRNKAIKLATADLIAFVDSDDWIEQDVLKKIYQKIEEGDNSDIIIFDCIVEYKEKSIKNSFYLKEGKLSKNDIEEIQLQNIGKGETIYFPNDCNVSVVWGKVYKKKFIIENNLEFIPEIKRMPDAIFNIQAFEKANSISHYKYFGYHYRKHTNSITQTNQDIKEFEVFLNEVNLYIKRYNKTNRFKNTYDRAILTILNMYLEANMEKDMQQELEELVKKEPYKQLNKIEYKKLNLYQKLILKNIKNKKWNNIKRLMKMKRKIKLLQQKEEQNVEPKIETLISVMNIQTEEELDKLIKKNNIKEKALFINQIKEKDKTVHIEKDGIRLYSYKEQGVSKSRNHAIDYAGADICLMADDDIEYVENYQDIIKNAYRKYPKADMIIFFVENENKEREENKRIRKGKLLWLDLMKARTYEISFRLDKIKEKEIVFRKNIGPGNEISKGEETIFLNDCYKNKLRIISVPEKIAIARNRNSTWFLGYNEKYFFDQGAIFYELSPKFYKILILQYIIRKRKLYKKNFSKKELYRIMKKGAEIYKKISKN